MDGAASPRRRGLMSTKYTVDSGDRHQLYLELFEPGRVYLRLTGAEFEARPGAVTVAIPLDLWERLRKVEIDDDVLTIEGERRQEREENRGGVYHSERSYGRFSRAIPLPEGAIPESAKATFKDGVLEITIQTPPSDTRKKQQVQIEGASSSSGPAGK